MKKLWIGLAILSAFALFWAKMLGHSTVTAEASSSTEHAQELAANQHRSIASKSPSSLIVTPPPVEAAALHETSDREAATLLQFENESRAPWIARREGLANRLRTLARGAWDASAESFVQRFAKDLFGVLPTNLNRLEDSVTDRTRITYQQVIYGTPVYGGTLSLFYEGQSLTRVQNDLVSMEPRFSAAPGNFSATDAFDRYKVAQTDVDVTFKTSAGHQTVLYPGPSHLVYAYQFSVIETQRGDPSAAKSFWVLYDAEDQRLIKKTPTEIQ